VCVLVVQRSHELLLELHIASVRHHVITTARHSLACNLLVVLTSCLANKQQAGRKARGQSNMYACTTTQHTAAVTNNAQLAKGGQADYY
jgi:hypothetical protein